MTVCPKCFTNAAVANDTAIDRELHAVHNGQKPAYKCPDCNIEFTTPGVIQP